MTRRHHESRAGFTLVEMMIAILAGSIAIASIYYMSAASARHFHEQQRVAQTQQALRMAMEQIRRDVERAGYLGTPASAAEQTCVAAAQPIQAVALVNNADDGALTNDVANDVHADRLRLTGNYATGDAYLIQSMNAAGTQFFLQKTWQGFRRSFGDPVDAAAFDQTFAAGRWLHVTTQEGNHLFLEITAADGAADPPTVTFTPSVSAASCATSILGSTVAPLSRIEYIVLDVGATPELSTLVSAASPLVGVNGPALVRREVGFDVAATPVAQSERIVAEYVAELDVDFVFDTAAATFPPTLSRPTDVAAVARLGTDPESVRSAIVRLSIRTAAEDPRFFFTAPTDPPTRYELDALVEGAARVRTATAEILIPNVAYRGLR